METKKKSNKKALAGLSVVLATMLAISAMTYAWFTSSVDPVSVNVTAAKIKVEKTGGGSWTIGGDADLLGKALPGETVSYGDVVITNTSNRNAVAKMDIDVKGYIIRANQTAKANTTIGYLKDWLLEKSNAEEEYDNYDLAEQLRDFAALITNDEIIIPANTKFFNYIYAHTYGYGGFESYCESNNYDTDSIGAVISGITHMTMITRSIANDIWANKILPVFTAANITTSPIVNDTNRYGEYFFGLGVPTASNATLSFVDLGFTIPSDLGGKLSDTDLSALEGPFAGYSLSDYNWGSERGLNEQQAKISVNLDLKVVQGTKAAVEDVFGISVEQNLNTDIQALISNN